MIVGILKIQIFLLKDVFVNNYQSILDLFKHDCNDIKKLRLKVAKCRKWLN